MIVYSWGGKPFQRQGYALYSKSGTHVGQIASSGDVFDHQGRYLGEFHPDRLIRNRSRAGHLGSGPPGW